MIDCKDRHYLLTVLDVSWFLQYVLAFIDTRPRRPGFKGHPIEFMIILDPYFGPVWARLNLIVQFEPI